MARSDEVRVRHMLESAREAAAFAAGKSLDDLTADRIRALAITRCIEIIGEAASAVTSEFRSSHPEIPWQVIVAMRNRLAHAYFSVDLPVVLDTAQQDLPPLIGLLEKIVEADNSNATPETNEPS
jgi:uncharacterized protein with HEPN domain